MGRTDYEGWMATAYDAGRSLTAGSVIAWRAAAEPFLATAAGGVVLDLGAGTGRFSRLIAKWSGAAVVAVEPAQAMLGQARAKRHGAQVSLLVGKAEAIPLRRASVQAAWLSNVVHHFASLAGAAQELGRVIEPGGFVLIRGAFGNGGAPARAGSSYLQFRYFPDALRHAEAFPSQEEVVSTFAASGFALEHRELVAQTTALSLADCCERLGTRADSTLAAIDDTAFAAGMAALEADVRRELAPDPVIDQIEFLVLRAHRSGMDNPERR